MRLIHIPLPTVATGEPPLVLGYGVVTALRAAVTAARVQAGNSDWFDMRECCPFACYY